VAPAAAADPAPVGGIADVAARKRLLLVEDNGLVGLAKHSGRPVSDGLCRPGLTAGLSGGSHNSKHQLIHQGSLAMRKSVLAIAGIVSAASIALVGCDVQKTQEGNVSTPKFEVSKTKEGDVTLPKYDVTAPKVDVTTEQKTVDVPKVGVYTEKETLTVPKVNVTPAKEAAAEKK
jgi:hypothetical protein